jgi:hypothetical protein
MDGFVQVALVEPTTEPTLALMAEGVGLPFTQVIRPPGLAETLDGLLLRHVAEPVTSRLVPSEKTPVAAICSLCRCTSCGFAGETEIFCRLG